MEALGREGDLPKILRMGYIDAEPELLTGIASVSPSKALHLPTVGLCSLAVVGIVKCVKHLPDGRISRNGN